MNQGSARLRSDAFEDKFISGLGAFGDDGIGEEAGDGFYGRWRRRVIHNFETLTQRLLKFCE